MPLPDMPAQAAALNASLAQTQESARKAGEEMRELSKSIFSYGRALLTLSSAPIFTKLAEGAWHQLTHQKQMIAGAKEQEVLATARIESMRIQLQAAIAANRYTTEEIRHEELLIDWQQDKLKLIREEVDFRERLSDLVRKNWEKFGLLAVLLSEINRSHRIMLATSRELNAVFVHTESSTSNRLALMRQVLRVQQGLGASTDSMADSAAALVAHGNHLTPGFATNLRLVTQLKEGLGMSAKSGAELVVIFTRQLKDAAERIADVIAQVAASTGLAAEKAAQYASEIGKALRLFGPQGMGREAAEVSKVITTMAGRIEAVGGNSASLVGMFMQMMGGTDQSAMMRRMAGTRMADLGTEKGIMDAMKRIVGVIDMRVTARDPEMYRFQLEQLSQEFGVSANDLANLRQIVVEWKNDLNTTRTAAQAYEEQTRLAGESWNQIKTSLRALVTEALTPTLRVIVPLVEGFADVAKGIASIRPLVVALQITVPIAVGVAVVSMWRLSKAIYRLAMDSKFASAAMSTKGLSGIRDVLANLPKLKSAFPVLSGMSAGASLKTIGSTFGLGAIGTTAIGVGLIAGSGLIGAALGRALDKHFPNNPLSSIARDVFRLWYKYDKVTDESKNWIKAQQGGTPLDAARSAAKLMAEMAIGGAGAPDKAQVDSAFKAAQEKLLLANPRWTPEYTRAVLTANAAQVAHEIGLLGEYTGLTQKSTEEAQRGKDIAAAAKALELQAKQLKEAEETRKIAEREHNLRMFDYMRKRADDHWKLAPGLDINSNAGAYRRTY